jgi:hypothetical protein
MARVCYLQEYIEHDDTCTYYCPHLLGRMHLLACFEEQANNTSEHI